MITPHRFAGRRALAIQLIINNEWGLAKNQNPNQGSFIVAPGFGAMTAQKTGPSRGPDDRKGYIQKWNELKETPGITDLDRWAQLMQHIVDSNPGLGLDEGEFISAVTDDLVDVFINDSDYRWILMDGESVLRRVVRDLQHVK